jgi:hypothetical protein
MSLPFTPDCGVQALLLATGSIQAALPIIAAIFTGVIACWIRAVSILHNTIKVLLLDLKCSSADREPRQE